MNQMAARLERPETQLAINGTGVSPETTRRCVLCKRRLRSPQWVALGIGPTCARKNPLIAAQLRERLHQQHTVEEGDDDPATHTANEDVVVP